MPLSWSGAAACLSTDRRPFSLSDCTKRTKWHLRSHHVVRRRLHKEEEKAGAAESEYSRCTESRRMCLIRFCIVRDEEGTAASGHRYRNDNRWWWWMMNLNKCTSSSSSRCALLVYLTANLFLGDKHSFCIESPLLHLLLFLLQPARQSVTGDEERRPRSLRVLRPREINI